MQNALRPYGKAVVLFVLLLSGRHLALAQEYTDEGDDSYGFTTITWNSANNKVIGYTETDMDDGFADYYEAVVNGTLSNGSGTALAAATVQDNDDTGSASVTLAVTGTPGQTYTMTGYHGGWLGFQDSVEGSRYYDGYDITYWAQWDMDMPDLFQFYEGGPGVTTPQQRIWVGYSIASATIHPKSQGGDQRDSIIAEYSNFGVSLQPSCTTFTMAAPAGSLFSFAQLNSGTYSWAILLSSLSTGINSIHANYSGTLTPNSGYRNPAKEYAIDQAQGARFAKNSRHEYGDAIDFAASSSTFPTLRNIAVSKANGCAEPKRDSGTAHVHVDWRQLDGLACPPFWRIVNV